MEIAKFTPFLSPAKKHQYFHSLLSNPFNYSTFSSSFHHNNQIRVSKSSTKFKRKSFRAVNCSTSLKDSSNFDNNSVIIADNDNIWSDFQFVEVISIGNRVDSVIDFCLSSISSFSSFRFWNVVGRESSRGQLHRRVLEKDDYPNIAEAPLNQQMHSKAVVLVASAGYGDEYVTAIDILKAIRSSGGLAVAVIVKPFSFEGQRRQDEVKILVDKLQNCVNFCIDIDIDTLLKMDMVTLDEALKTAYQAVLSSINAVSIIISDTYKKHIQSLHGSMTQITVGEAIKVLESYNKGRVGFGVANNIKASIVQAVYDCPFLSVGLKDLDGVVVCILSSSSPIGDVDISTNLRTFREATECTKEVILSIVLNPDLKPNLISTTILTVCASFSDRKSLQSSSILSRLADSIPFFFNFLRGHDEKSGKSEKNNHGENIFPPIMTNFMNEMLLDEDCDEKEFEDGETDKVQYLDSDDTLSKSREQNVRDQTFGRNLLINRNLRPGYRISQDSPEEEPNVSGADPLTDNPRIFQLPVGVRLSDDLQDTCDKSNLSRSVDKINAEVQMQASTVPPLIGMQDVGFDAVTGLWNSASALLKKKQPIVSKKQGGLSARAASMLESERDTKTKWSPVMEICYRGGVYKGRCQGGLPEGRGRLTFLDGTVYDGMWRYGKRSGVGSLFFSNGDVFHGSWRDDLMHGKGWLYFHTGERWFANFWKGRANGEGRFYSKSGEVIFGHFQDGWRHGQFLRVKVDGTRFVETWDDGVLTSSEELDS